MDFSELLLLTLLVVFCYQVLSWALIMADNGRRRIILHGVSGVTCHVLSPVVVTNVSSPTVSVHLTLPLTPGDGVWHRNEAREAAAHGVTLTKKDQRG